MGGGGEKRETKTSYSNEEVYVVVVVRVEGGEASSRKRKGVMNPVLRLEMGGDGAGRRGRGRRVY